MIHVYPFLSLHPTCACSRRGRQLALVWRLLHAVVMGEALVGRKWCIFGTGSGCNHITKSLTHLRSQKRVRRERLASDSIHPSIYSSIHPREKALPYLPTYHYHHYHPRTSVLVLTAPHSLCSRSDLIWEGKKKGRKRKRHVLRLRARTPSVRPSAAVFCASPARSLCIDDESLI
ncbi:uncharacterized protein J3D65DRAFT_459121 [Phyllosticta citribraziliensis]|uniref:Uncharacterized protein n=1 Tax=Phyllosticta citribraziliensis TaxID=989973 RepID=A0ABR1LF46_9PEZI